MLNKIMKSIVILSSALCLTTMTTPEKRTIDTPQVTIETQVVKMKEYSYIHNEPKLLKSMTIERFTEQEIDLMALITMAEAEGESEYGKRLVISTILNRVDSEHYPDNVTDVIYQKNQFSSIWDGRADRCYVKEEIRQLVKEEIENRTNNEVIFFMAGDYSDYGTPMFAEGGHYFSSYE